jgi:hypothetical protein
VAAIVAVAARVTVVAVAVAAIGAARDAGVTDALAVAVAGRAVCAGEVWVGGLASVARDTHAAISRCAATSIIQARCWVIFM